MKIILLNDVKGKGKKYETIDVPNGYGTFLIRNNEAVVANKENENKIKDELTLQLEKETLKMLEAVDIKNTINGHLTIFYTKSNPDGSCCESFTKKDLIGCIKRKYDIDIDSKMINMKAIRQFGKHEIEIKLYPDVIAKVEVLIECIQN